MKRLATLCILTVTTLFISRTTHAQLRSAGYIDTAFAAPCFSNNPGNFATRALAVQTNGNILAAGNFATPQSCVNGIGRLRADGATDNTFRSPFFAGDFVNALAVLPSGRILAGGNMHDGSFAFGLARVNANGALDNSFQRTINGLAVIINSLAVQADNRIVAVGFNFSLAPNFFGIVVRLNTNGSVDATFAPGGSSPGASNQFSAVAVQSGKILVGGTFTNYSDGATTLQRDGLVRLNANGAVDVPFHPLISNSRVFALLVQPDNKILVAGQFDMDGGTRMLTRLNPDGSRDTSFTSLNSLGGAIGLSLALQPDGKILLGQSFGVARLLTNGAIDTTFGPRNDAISLGTAAVDATALARTADGHVLVGATTVFVDTTVRRSVARLFGDVPPPPFITQQPVTQTVEAGTNVTFSIIATGAPPILYQWRKNNVNIKGATNSTLSLPGVDSTDTANYVAVLSNPGGSVTSAVARLIVNFHTSPLTLTVMGAGTVKPNLDGRVLEIGRSYTLTAKPATANLFSNWTGGVTSSSPVLTFVMQSNLMLVAHFVPSPFLPVKGVYTGLFFDANSPPHQNAGFVSLALDDKGGYKGTVRTGAQLRKFAGKFSLDLTSHLAVASVPTTPALDLPLQLDLNTGVVAGYGSNSFGNISLWAYRNPFSSSANPAPNAGLYNAAFLGIPGGAIAGDGFAALTVSTSGRVSGRGMLADGYAVQILSATANSALVPVYVPLYGGQGSLFGWLTVTNSGVNHVAGPLWWFKPASAGGLNPPGGISNTVPVMGSRYVAPAPRTPVLTLSNGVVILSGGNLTNSMTNSITLGSDNKIAGDNQLTLRISPTKGSITGSFVDPSNGQIRNVKGVALPTQQQGRGFFPVSNTSGHLFIGDQP